eukprot:5521959-Pyramimonas_sp.AAC.1
MSQHVDEQVSSPPRPRRGSSFKHTPTRSGRRAMRWRVRRVRRDTAVQCGDRDVGQVERPSGIHASNPGHCPFPPSVPSDLPEEALHVLARLVLVAALPEEENDLPRRVLCGSAACCCIPMPARAAHIFYGRTLE